MSRGKAFLWVSAAYVLAGVAALGTVAFLPVGPDPMVRVAAADLAATVVVFLFSVAFGNTSFYDPYWSVAPLVIAPYLWLGFGDGAVPARQVLVTALVFAWGLRLTYNWARGWSGLDHEDWRYVDLRNKTGKAFVVVNFLGLQLFPTVLVFLGCLSLVPALVTGDRPLSALDAVAAVVTGGAVLIEGLADNQLRAFVRSKPPAGTVMERGLWSWSRHPNYFGEISFWCGLALFGLAAGGPTPVLLVGPGVMIALFVGVSVPMMEKRMLARRPGYPEYKRRVSALIPLPPRRS
ncbi:MAG: DUF1295 domain-containing protein [Deltaproteobacteria bacterium]|nr:DUF1295 domain-containing protein [Deltaproteobacteria bacterium]